MKPIRLCKASRGCALLVTALVSICWLVPGEAVPQEQKDVPKEQKKERPKSAAPKERPAPTTEMQVLQAKFVKARELGPVIQQILANHWGLRVSFDERSNSVIVVATPEDMATVRELIKNLDVPKPSSEESRVVFLPLKYTKIDSGLQNALARLLPSNSYVFDVERNQIIVSGDKKILEAAMFLLDKLDRPPDTPKISPKEMQIRVIWLASGPPHKEGRKPPDDMKEVVAELAKMGVEQPRLVAQTMVSTLPGNQFRTEGLAELDQTYRLTVSGTMSSNHQLQISIAASLAGPRGQGPFTVPTPAPIARLDTEITAPPGHSVVLGMTPTPNSTSVFVVQILPKK
jgi:Bacterial type II/III secretion system short domain